jgi:hypothetical protein
MKKALAVILCVLLAFALCACGSSTDTTTTKNDGSTQALDTVNDTQNAGTTLSTPATNAESDTTLSSLAVRQDEGKESAAAAQLDQYDVDIDLKGLNNNMTTAQMQSIMQDVKPYLGKTIRVTGLYEKTHYDETNLDYNWVIGYDDTGCCAAWSVEIAGDELPKDLAPDTTISLVGTIGTYDELGVTYTVINIDHFAQA